MIILKYLGLIFRIVVLLPLLLISILGFLMEQLGEYGTILREWVYDMNWEFGNLSKPVFYTKFKELTKENEDLKRQLKWRSQEKEDAEEALFLAKQNYDIQ